VLIDIFQTLLLVTAFIAVWDAWQLTAPPADPILCGSLATDAILRLNIKSEAPALFQAGFTSDYWANEPDKQFQPNSRDTSLGEVEFELERHSSRRTSYILSGVIEIKRLRCFLWVRLPPITIARVPLGHLIKQKRSCTSLFTSSPQ
jgi:hypothetical protein